MFEDTVRALAEKHFPGRVKVVFESDPRREYLMMAEKRGKHSVLHVNLAWKRDLIEMLDMSYIEAIVEHEAAHVRAKIPHCLGVSISAPLGVGMKYGTLVHRHVTRVLNEALSDTVNDAFAVAFMNPENAKKYIYWIAYKNAADLTESRRIGLFGRIKVLYLIQAGLVEALAEELDAPLPELHRDFIRKEFRGVSDAAILEMLREIFKKAYRAARDGAAELDLRSEFILLHEAVLRHEPFEF